MAEKYEWRAGAPYSGDPQVVGEKIAALAAQYVGGLLPEHVVAAARKDKALEPYFVWDDTEAAKRYRDEQARGLMRAVIRVDIKTSGGEVVKYRAFPCVDTEEKGAKAIYVTLEESIRSPVYRAQLLRRAMFEIHNWRERYRQLKELGAIFDAIDGIES